MKSQKGFTLIELVLVIALMSISFGITADILVSLVRTQSRTQVQNEVEQQANFVALKLERELRNARDASFTSDGLSLIISRRDSVIVTYTVTPATGLVTRKTVTPSNTTVTLPLTIAGNGGIRAMCATEGSCFSVDNESPKIVNVDMVFVQGQADATAAASYTAQIPLKTTFVIRSTY